MRRRISSRDLVILANVGTARSITGTACFRKRWVSLYVSGQMKSVILLSKKSADMYSINLMAWSETTRRDVFSSRNHAKAPTYWRRRG